MKMKWLFPENPYGEDKGFHNAGIETFRGDYYRNLSREIIQNSLDARPAKSGKPIVVKFNLVEIPTASLGLPSLSATFNQCENYWEKDAAALEFFAAAKKVAAQSKVKSLLVGDYNTTGVAGSDEVGTGWHSLVCSSGSSSKSQGEGGSYGIGKNAPFAASKLQTVLYASYTANDTKFRGIARLVTHRDYENRKLHDVGYLGNEADGSTIYQYTDIPATVRRPKKEHGTDVIILGFKEESNWQEEIVKSVLENFWPAIQFGDLEVEIDTHTISKNTLSDLMKKFGGQSGFTANLYFEAFTNKDSKIFRPWGQN